MRRVSLLAALAATLLALCASSLALASPAGAAARRLEITVQDDALLLHRSPATVRRVIARMVALGVDRVRITAGWSALAPDAGSGRRPRGFDGKDSRDYPSEPMSRLDHVVRSAAAEGLAMQIDLAFWAPRWAVTRPLGDGRERWAPRTRRYAQFVTAIARRYSGRFRDPRRRGRRLPAVRMWTTWNEPNHPVFLMPQWRRTAAGGWRPASPHVYRRMHEAAYTVLKRIAPANQVLVGGLASRGGRRRCERSDVGPLRFTRELACVDGRLRRLRVPECRGFRPLRADGFAHHPYSFDTPPHVATTSAADAVRMGDLHRLSGLLETLAARGRIERRLPLYLTEYGYETNPPDPGRGVSPVLQARYHGQARYLAWRDPSTRMFAQFLLRDIGPDLRYRAGSVRRWHDYQTGLYTFRAKAKPAVRAFKMPFWAEIAPGGVLVFGQVRPGRGGHRVVLERRRGDGSWRAVPSVARGALCCAEIAFATDAEGFYLRTLPDARPGTLRARWMRPGGRREHSVAFALRSLLSARHEPPG